MSNLYQCDHCKGEFKKKGAIRFFLEFPNDEKAVLCQDCFEEFKQWFGSLTLDDYKRIQSEAMKAYDERTGQ